MGYVLDLVCQRVSSIEEERGYVSGKYGKKEGERERERDEKDKLLFSE